MSEVEATASALAGAHAALWGYGLLAPHLDDADEAAAAQAYAAYRTLREQLTTYLVEAGEDPVAAEPAYALPFPVTDGSSARRLAVHLDDGYLPLLGDLVAAAERPELRTTAVEALIVTARRRIRFGADPVAFPGL